MVDPAAFHDVDAEAGNRALQLAQTTTPKFNPWRFAGAVVISIGLLCAAIWTGKHDLPDISKQLMTSFSAFSGIVLGLLGGEAQKVPAG